MNVLLLDPLLDEKLADDMLELRDRFGNYGMYSNEGFNTTFAPELAQRYDAAVNFVRTGGRFGRQEEKRLLAARTNYFRETYAYGDEVFVDGIETFYRHESLLDAARQLHGRPVIEPAIVYANMLAPGQELAVHTDVPEFRGANRKVLPQWLLVVMHHSALFDEWRMPITTAISYFGGGSGGELAYYPDGPGAEAATLTPRHNSAAVLDTDSVFHGVDRVGGDDDAVALLRPGMRLQHEGESRWTVRDGEDVVTEYTSDELRYSVSWKAYCFADDAEKARWRDHSEDLDLPFVLNRLENDLRQRGVLEGPRPADAEFGKLLIQEYVHFPTPVA